MEATAPGLRMIRAYFKYFPVMVLLLALTGFLQLTAVAGIDRIYYLAATVAGLLGIIHVLLLYGFFGLNSTAFVKQCSILTAAILLASAAITGIGYNILNLDIYFLAYLTAFAIPFLLSLGYSYYLQIPGDVKHYWYHPLEPELTPLHLDESETELIKFVVKKSPRSSSLTSFTLDAPVDLPVSQIFMNLINEHNKSNQDHPIEYFDANHIATGWLFFYREGILLKKYFIDPNLSARDNQISTGRVINAIREERTEQSRN